MRVFLDTSSLVQFYHEEPGSGAVDAVLENNQISSIILSDLTRVEFLSALWKKYRTGELTGEMIRQTILLFDHDAGHFTFVPIAGNIIEEACTLLNKYGATGLRSLDSIQLATAIFLKEEADLFLTSDKLLKSLFEKEHLQTDFEQTITQQV